MSFQVDNSCCEDQELVVLDMEAISEGRWTVTFECRSCSSELQIHSSNIPELFRTSRREVLPLKKAKTEATQPAESSEKAIFAVQTEVLSRVTTPDVETKQNSLPAADKDGWVCQGCARFVYVPSNGCASVQTEFTKWTQIVRRITIFPEKGAIAGRRETIDVELPCTTIEEAKRICVAMWNERPEQFVSQIHH